MSDKTKKFFVVALAAITGIALAAPPDGTDADSEKSIVSRVTERLTKAENEGTSRILRITRDGVVLIERGFGSAKCEGQEVVTPKHVFMIGSITREFTKVLTFVLVEKGPVVL